MDKNILKKLNSIDLSNYPDVHKYTKPSEKALWVLLVVKKGLKCPDYLSAKEISELLLEVGISCKHIKLTRALARTGDIIDKKGTKGASTFKIMKKGEEYLEKMGDKNKLSLLYIDGTKPWSDRKILSDKFIKHLKGEILVVDKFFGSATLDILAEFGNKKKIKFLTAKITDTSSKFKRDIKRFKVEHKNIEVKIYPREYELHDRYLLTDNEVCLLGHGFKDIGTKESFILVLCNPAGKEIRNTLKARFNERWVMAQKFIP